MQDRLHLLCLGVLLFLYPRAFRWLAARWYPAEYDADENSGHHARAAILRRRFWGAAGVAVCLVASILLIQGFWYGGIPVQGSDWLRVAAVILAITAALGRAGWEIQSWGGNTVIERIDRGTYLVAQLGTAALLILVITL